MAEGRETASLNELRRQLGDENEEARHDAVQRLKAFAAQALSLLAEALGDRSWRVRKAALETVVAIPGEEKMKVILDGVRDEDNASRRNTCMEALIRLGAEAMPYLPELLGDGDSDVRKFGVDILGNIDDAQVHGYLLEALEDDEDNVAASAAEYLGRKRHAPAIPYLIARLERGDFWVKYSCVRALGQIADPKAAAAVLRLAGGELRKVALEALGRMRVPEAEPFVLEGLFSADRGLRKTAILAAAALMHGEGVREGPARSLSEKIAREADAAYISFLDGLTRGEDIGLAKASMVVLVAAAAGGAIDPLLAMVPDLGEEEQGFVAGVLEQLPGEAIHGLIPKLRDEQAAVRRWAAHVLGRRGGREAIPHLIGLLEDENGHVRSTAARALGETGDQVAAASLVPLLGDPYPDVRQAGADALCAIGKRGEEQRRLVVQLLDPHLGSQDEDAAANAFRVAAALGSRDVMDRLKFALKDDRSQVRRAAVKALAAAGPEALEALRVALTDEDATVRREAVQRIGESAQPGRLPLLLPMLQDDDLWVRVHAVQALSGLAADEARDELLRIVETEDAGPVKLAAIRGLGRMRAEEACDLLMRLAKTGDREVKVAAVEALGRIGGRPAVETLSGFLEEEDWGLRSAAVRALAPAAREEEVRRRLETVLREDGDPLVRKAAADILGRPPS